MIGEKSENPLMTELAAYYRIWLATAILGGIFSHKSTERRFFVCQSIKKGRLASTASSI